MIKTNVNPQFTAKTILVESEKYAEFSAPVMVVGYMYESYFNDSIYGGENPLNGFNISNMFNMIKVDSNIIGGIIDIGGGGSVNVYPSVGNNNYLNPDQWAVFFDKFKNTKFLNVSGDNLYVTYIYPSETVLSWVGNFNKIPV